MVSSFASPVVLIGGWTIAAVLQPRPFNQVASTVSALAAIGAADRWVMTLVFLVVGVCDIVTAAALRPAAPAGRVLLIAGAACGMVVAAYPENARGGLVEHAVWAGLAFAGLAAWPAAAWRRGRRVPWGLRPAVCAGAVAVQIVLLAWFVGELLTAAGQIGLAERVVGGTQAIWPLVVVLSCRASAALAWPLLARRRAPVRRGDEAPQREALGVKSLRRQRLATSACLARTASAASRRAASSVSVRSRSTIRRTPVRPISASTPR